MLTILHLARTRDELKIVYDQTRNPTWSRILAEVTAQVIAQRKSGLRGYLEDKSGVYKGL